MGHGRALRRRRGFHIPRGGAVRRRREETVESRADEASEGSARSAPVEDGDLQLLGAQAGGAAVGGTGGGRAGQHADQSSGVVDGAAAVLLASREYAEEHGLTPRGRVVATANVGDDPTLMLNAPVPAAKKVLAKAGLTKDDIDLWELNEAFAVQVLYCADTLGIPMDRLNVNGGAIAVGHPFGMTGARLQATMINSLQHHDKQTGLITMCVGGGQGMALILERLR